MDLKSQKVKQMPKILQSKKKKYLKNFPFKIPGNFKNNISPNNSRIEP